MKRVFITALIFTFLVPIVYSPAVIIETTFSVPFDHSLDIYGCEGLIDNSVGKVGVNYYCPVSINVTKGSSVKNCSLEIWELSSNYTRRLRENPKLFGSRIEKLNSKGSFIISEAIRFDTPNSYKLQYVLICDYCIEENCNNFGHGDETEWFSIVDPLLYSNYENQNKILKIQQESLEQLKESNRRTYILALVSIIVTGVIFGLLNIGINFLSNSGEIVKNFKKYYKKIKKKLCV